VFSPESTPDSGKDGFVAVVEDGEEEEEGKEEDATCV